MIPDFSGDFLSFESTEDGDIITILDEGKEEFNQVLKKNMFNISVKRADKTMIYSPNNKSGKLLQQAFGKDTKQWINKKFQVFHIEKKMLIKPLAETKV